MTDDQGGLPRIGGPATRALAAVGVTRLEQLQQHRSEDLLALHGIGPKAISQLGAALADHKMSFLADLAERRSLPDEVQQYVDALDAPHRRLFDRLHGLIVDELPDAQIVFAYQIPLYRLGRRHVGLNARADGITLTTTAPDHIEEFKRRNPHFKTNKASIQFRLDDELPEADIRDVIRRATID